MSSIAAIGSIRYSLPGVRRYDRTVVRGGTDTITESLDVAFAAGRAELREVYEAHSSLVFGLCRKSLGPDAAGDVTQEVFVSAWRGRQQFDPERGNLGQWLVGITKRRIIDHLRSEGRHANRRADEEAAPASAHTSDEARVDQMADQMIVAEGLAQLGDRARQVIELAYIHDLTHQEIADRTGLPLGTIKSDIRRGLKRIRTHLETRHV